MKWLWLGASILCEVLGTTCLKLAGQSGRNAVYCVLLTVVLYVTCFYGLSKALNYFEIGTAYAIWSGVGLFVLTLAGILFFGDSFSALKLISMALIIIGIVGLNCTGAAH